MARAQELEGGLEKIARPTFKQETMKETSLSPGCSVGEACKLFQQVSDLSLDSPYTGYMHLNLYISNAEAIKSHLGL